MIAAIYFRGPAWNESAPIVGQSAFAGHLEWVAEYRDRAGAPIVEVAPFHDPAHVFTDDLVGLALVDVDSLEEARKIVELDPMVSSGTFTFRVYAWGGKPLRRSQ